MVNFTNEVNAYTIGDGDGFVIKSEVADVTVADVPSPMTVAIDNVTVTSSVKDVVAVATVNSEVGGSIVSSDANIPDQDNLYVNYNRRTMLLHLLSLRKPKKLIADNRTDYKSTVIVGEIPTNVGKLA